MFDCVYVKKAGKARRPDPGQTRAEWDSLRRLGSLRLYPAALKILLAPDGKRRGPVYLGDTN
jgi:hypothetical protein